MIYVIFFLPSNLPEHIEGPESQDQLIESDNNFKITLLTLALEENGLRIGLLADIHANAHALEVALNQPKKKRQKLLCCGDYVGYYHEPDKIIQMLDS